MRPHAYRKPSPSVTPHPAQPVSRPRRFVATAPRLQVTPSSGRHGDEAAIQRVVNRALQHGRTLSRVPLYEPGLGKRIRAAAVGGAVLDAGIRRRLEAGLGADLSGLRIHANGAADRLAGSVQATAFTVGSHIFFRSGFYRPGSREGMRLLAHEATHAVQQAAGPVVGTPIEQGVTLSDPGDAFERAAERAAGSVVEPACAALQHRPLQGRAGWQSTVGTGPLRIQRVKQKQKVTMTPGGRVKSVALKKRPATNVRGRQGHHTTPHIALMHLVENAVRGKTLQEAADELAEQLTQTSYLPGMQKPQASQVVYRNLALPYPNPTDETELAEDAQHVFDVRSQVPLTAYQHPGAMGSGINESLAKGLQDMETRLRNGTALTQQQRSYTANDIKESIWDLFHFNPQQSTSEAEVAAAMIQHAYTMWKAYPQVCNHFNVDTHDILQYAMQNNAHKYHDRLQHANRSNVYRAPAFVRNVGGYIDNYINHQQIPQLVANPSQQYVQDIGRYAYTLQ